MSHKKHHETQQQPDSAENTAANGAAVPPAAPQAAPESEDLAKVRAQRDDYLARLQRLSAEFANYQKRAGREVNDLREWANADLLKSLLPVLDDLERAIDAASTVHATDPLLVGTKLVHDKAVETLGRFGLTPIDAQGKPFDPQYHQAVMHMPAKDQPANTVMQVLQKGYLLKGKTLRPATVVVAKEPEAEPEQEKKPE